MKRLLVVIATAFTLAGCASNPSFQTQNPDGVKQVKSHWLAWQDRLSRVEAWNIEGRAAVTTADDSGTVSVFWDQAPDAFRLRMAGPFGAGSLDIRSDEQGVFMQDSDGNTRRAATAEGLVWMQTGWEIPISDMRAWILGAVGDPENPSVRVDQYGHTLAFDSGEWHVQIPEYTETQFQGELLAVPRKVFLQSPYIKIKMIVSDWSVR
ncbi:outer membrane lipoprotein LolB [gamma proteobacterium HTCC5015]|nr:outer membrane lipoprotein LolB [gamma proteobacterium HTCC5015]